MTTATPSKTEGPHEARTAEGDLLILTHAVLDERALINSVKDPRAGAVCSFIGTTRDTFEDKVVTHLAYQSYVPLCLSTLRSIATAARSHPALVEPPAAIHHIAIAHRLGVVPTGETSIVIAVSASHRRESFALCEWLLEEVKKKAQVWKREVYADGTGVEGAVDGGSEPQSTWKENFKDGKW